MQQIEKNYISPFGMKTLQDEYDFLVKVERPKTIQIVSWAASNGDRSENADYIYGKKRLRQIDSRLRFLKKRIENAEVVNSINFDVSIIRFGACVEYETEDGMCIEVTIVGIDEIDSEKGYISWKSPLGKALLNKSTGDDVIVTTPQGKKEIVITNISYREIKGKGFVNES